MADEIKPNDTFSWTPTEQVFNFMHIRSMLEVSIQMQARIIAKLENISVQDVEDKAFEEVGEHLRKIAVSLKDV